MSQSTCNKTDKKTFFKKAIPEIIKLIKEINNTVIGSGNIKKQPSQPHRNEP